jgi:GntR family transcriptional repressor for pyruvate dehydrogenase complex
MRPAYPRRQAKLADRTARSILDGIVRDQLSAGARLPSEQAMQRDHGVSRSSLREALRLLEAAGIIGIKTGPGGGPFVRQVDASDHGRATSAYLQRMNASFSELWSAYALLEPTVARLAAQHCDDRFAELLNGLCAESARLVDAGAEWDASASAFHGAITGASGNRVLEFYLSSLLFVTSEAVGAVRLHSRARHDIASAHQGIAEAITGRDGDLAEERARAHLQEVAKYVGRYCPPTQPIRWR